MVSLQGLAYLLLGIEFLSRSAEEDQRRTRERRNGTAAAASLGWASLRGNGGDFSNAEAQRTSPVFRQAARATIYEDGGDLNQRVGRIVDLIRRGSLDPAIRQRAIAVLSKRNAAGGWAVPEKDWRAEAAALFNHVRQNVRYTRDHVKLDTFVHPARTLFDVAPGSGGGEDCDGFTITLGALLRAVGHNVKVRVIAARNPGAPDPPPFNHVYLVDELPTGGAIAGGRGALMALDASIDRPAGWEVPKDRIYRTRDFEIKD